MSDEENYLTDNIGRLAALMKKTQQNILETKTFENLETYRPTEETPRARAKTMGKRAFMGIVRSVLVWGGS